MFQEIDPKKLPQNVFSLWDDQWALITAGTEDRCNTMTASWGGLGILWDKAVATIYVRPQRYTYQFLEKNPAFTLCFFGEEWRDQLNFCGTVSGRTVDKIQECGFTLRMEGEHAPYFEEAQLVLVCKKLYWNDLDPKNLDSDLLEWYPDKDFHRMYLGEITKALWKK